VVLRIDIGIVDETVRRLTAPGQPLEVSEREFAGATHRVFVHAAATAVDVIQSLRVHGDAELLVFNDRRWTYEQFFDDVDALSATLQLDFGVTPGDRLAIAMRNCADWLITFAAAIQVGAVVVPVNSWGSGEELAFTLLNSEATVLAADLPRTQAAPTPLRQPESRCCSATWTATRRRCRGWHRRNCRFGPSPTPSPPVARALTRWPAAHRKTPRCCCTPREAPATPKESSPATSQWARFCTT
jgi:non-ribosomal peptide synthetase component F